MVTLRVGWYPTGFQSPAAVRPAERPDRAAVERQFREGLARVLALERERLPARARDLFVKHPGLGVLARSERHVFHPPHCLHSRMQLRAGPAVRAGTGSTR